MIRTVKKGITLKLILAGVLAGFANGLLGAGGGIVAVVALTRLMGDSFENKNDIFATALCVMLPLSALSTIIYLWGGHMSLEGMGALIPPAVLGGIVGGVLLGRLDTRVVKRLFSAIMALSGILLIVR
jgi:uncharacterized membrane protein YfcA